MLFLAGQIEVVYCCWGANTISTKIECIMDPCNDQQTISSQYLISLKQKSNYVSNHFTLHLAFHNDHDSLSCTYFL